VEGFYLAGEIILKLASKENTPDRTTSTGNQPEDSERTIGNGLGVGLQMGLHHFGRIENSTKYVRTVGGWRGSERGHNAPGTYKKRVVTAELGGEKTGDPQ